MIDVDALLEAHARTRAGSTDAAIAMSAATSYAIFELQAAVGDGVPTYEQLKQFTMSIALGAGYLFDLQPGGQR